MSHNRPRTHRAERRQHQSTYSLNVDSVRTLATVRAIINHHRAFTRDDAETAARLFNESGRRRGSLTDCMIAAAALADGAAVATANPADFQRLHDFGVKLAS